MTESVLKGVWSRHTDGRFSQGSCGASLPNPVPALQEFLKLLKPYADQSNPLAGTPGNYEDLFFLAEQVAADAQSQVDNPAIHPFVTELKKQTQDLTDILHKPIGELASLACELIRSVVHQSLATPHQIRGLELVRALAVATDIEMLDIVTLNHDLLIECLLEQANIPYADGFDVAEGDVRYFAPPIFESAARVRLFKLHGSINWFRFRGERKNPFTDRYGIPVGRDPNHCWGKDGKVLDNIDVIPWILAGTHTKPLQYNFGIFAEMHFWFHKLLKEHDVIAMSGYGWNDRGINGRLIEWLHSSRPKRLLLMHEKPDELESFSKSQLWHSYQSLAKVGRIIAIPKWMQDVTLEQLSAKIKESIPN